MLQTTRITEIYAIWRATSLTIMIAVSLEERSFKTEKHNIEL